MPRAEGLALAARRAGAREHQIVEAAVKLATVREDFLSGQTGPAYASWVRRTFGPHARALGFREKPGEDDEVRLARPTLAEFVARRGEDPRLVAEARSLAGEWLSRGGLVDGETVAAALRTAGRFGGRDLHQALVQRLDQTANPRTRDWLLGGISSTRVPELLDQNVALATSGRLNPREMAFVLTGEKRRQRYGPLDTEPARARILAGVDRSWDTLVALTSRGGIHRFFALASESCSPGERAEDERVFGPRVKSVLGGPRDFSLALEKLDLCIEQRAREVQELERFFPPPRPTRAASGG